MAISCTQAQDRMIEWINQELPDQEAQDLESHLDGCGLCQQAYDQLLSLTSQLRSLDHLIPPADLPQRIHMTIEAEMHCPRSVWAICLSGFRTLFPLSRTFALRFVPALLIIVAALFTTKAIFWTETPSSPREQRLAFRVHSGVKRVTFGQIKQQTLRISTVSHVSQEFPEATTDIWGQPVTPDIWKPANSLSADSVE